MVWRGPSPAGGGPATLRAMRRLILLLALLTAASAVAAAPTAASPARHHAGTAAAASFRAPSPCGRLRRHPANIRHLIVIVMENHSYSEVLGHAPYLTALARVCGVATNYHSVGHPSLPNYLAMTSGSTHGISSDCEPTACPLGGPSIFSQLTARRMLWQAFDESMPSHCSLGGTRLYAPRHNPAVYYTAVRSVCRKRDVRAGSPTSGPLHSALTSGLGKFSFVTPNICNDMHDCPVSVGARWLAKWIPAMRASRSYQAGHTAIVIVWDEGGGGHVPLIVVSPNTPAGARTSHLFTHYSLLHMAESVLGITNYLGHAAATCGLGSAFRLR
jgi:phosphatidylinositol-3-phosphatase